MEVLMLQSKIKAEGVADVQAAVKKVLVALDAAQPEGLRYAPCLLPDGQTFVAHLQIDDGVENPLQDLPEYKETLEIVERLRAALPVVQPLTVIGSYQSF